MRERADSYLRLFAHTVVRETEMAGVYFSRSFNGRVLNF